MKRPVAIVVLIAAIVLLPAFWWFKSSSLDPNPQLPSTPADPLVSFSPEADTRAVNEDDQVARDQVTDTRSSDQSIPDIVTDIYDEDDDFRIQVLAAFEEIIGHYPREVYERSRAVLIDRSELITGGLMHESSFPDTISISPFPDTQFVADKTEFLHHERLGVSRWRGSLQSPADGYLHIVATGPSTNNELHIEIWNKGVKTVFVAMESLPDAYAVIEINPNLVQDID